ncbi:MAG: C40 family peptidase [Saccharofermentanales bacterium]
MNGIRTGVSSHKTAVLSAIRRNSALVVSVLFVSAIIAPVFSFSPSADMPAADICIGYDATSEDSVKDGVAPDYMVAAQTDTDAGEYFDPDNYEVSDYSRTDYALLNRGAAMNSEDLLFGSVNEADMENGLKAPPDMTFKDDNTKIYVHCATLNMRALPSSESEIVGRFKLGDSFLRTGIGPNWDRIVDSKGVTGYVFNDFVDDAKPTPTPAPKPKYGAPAKANSLGEAIALEAQRYIGIRYRWAQEDPAIGFDCSGLTWYVYNRFGISTPRGTNAYARAGIVIPYAQIMVGDVIAWDTVSYDGRTSITHVGIYIGSGKMVHASSSHNRVMIASVSDYKRGAKLVSVHRFNKN